MYVFTHCMYIYISVFLDREVNFLPPFLCDCVRETVTLALPILEGKGWMQCGISLFL